MYSALTCRLTTRDLNRPRQIKYSGHDANHTS
uniref:Uncharacterized protein n=1 Tax=Arundo donax TaxID=35708 RepID=A0A0A9APU7_ARUDO